MADELSSRKKRFTPVPIETTFRKSGLAAELTPEPSPVSATSPSPSPPPEAAHVNKTSHKVQDERRQEKRRFAPQLVESSRRSRRIGDVGPATRPTDKTDITPYTKHIYAYKQPKWKALRFEALESQSRRESCDDEIALHVFDLIARDAEKRLAQDAEKRLQEVAMSAYPNSGIRTGGAEHFWVREGSEDDSSPPSRGRSVVRKEHEPRKPSRRDSSQEDVGWAVREMQEHHDRLSRTRAQDRISTLDLDNMHMESPPEDPTWITSRKSSETEIRPMGEQLMPFIPSQPLPIIVEKKTPAQSRPHSPPPPRPIGETFMPYIPSAPEGKASHMPYVPSSRLPAETEFRSQPAFGGFGYGYQEREMAADVELQKLRNRASPPMLGKDIVFRTCPSPQQTKLEPEHLWTGQNSDDEAHRDPTGEHGLWNGYCYDPTMGVALSMFDRDRVLDTPFPPSTSYDPFSASFGAAHRDPKHPYNSSPEHFFSDEPSNLYENDLSSSKTTVPYCPASPVPTTQVSTSEHRLRNGSLKGVHLVHGLDEKLRKAAEAKPKPIPIAQLDENIAAEFNDEFVTQVYNYLSLGYPAMARFYDDELAKISLIPTTELERDDENIMIGIGNAKGHINIGTTGSQAVKGLNEETAAGKINADEPHCPRWMALKGYIHEWARQHPDLNSISPLAWGVRERRGSWAL